MRASPRVRAGRRRGRPGRPSTRWRPRRPRAARPPRSRRSETPSETTPPARLSFSTRGAAATEEFLALSTQAP